MRQILPENGYESPRSPDDNNNILFGQGILSGERRRGTVDGRVGTMARFSPNLEHT